MRSYATIRLFRIYAMVDWSVTQQFLRRVTQQFQSHVSELRSGDRKRAEWRAQRKRTVEGFISLAVHVS